MVKTPASFSFAYRLAGKSQEPRYGSNDLLLLSERDF